MFAKVFVYIALLGLATASFNDQPDYHASQPYKFGYSIKDKHGEQYRQEEGNGGKAVKGSYGFTDERGVKRQVDYVADHAGFRAQVKTNEPGTANQNPAAVQMISDAPYSGNFGMSGLGYNNGAYGLGNAGLGYSNGAYGLGNGALGNNNGVIGLGGGLGNAGLGYSNGAYGLSNGALGNNNGVNGLGGGLGNVGLGYGNGAYGLSNGALGYNNGVNGVGLLGGLGYTRYGY